MGFYKEEIARLFKGETFITSSSHERFWDFTNEGWRISHWILCQGPWGYQTKCGFLVKKWMICNCWKDSTFFIVKVWLCCLLNQRIKGYISCFSWWTSKLIVGTWAEDEMKHHHKGACFKSFYLYWIFTHEKRRSRLWKSRQQRWRERERMWTTIWQN